MRELSSEELAIVNGGSLADSIEIGGGAGAAAGIIFTNTMRGAAAGGALGAALGFSFGVGYSIGSFIYRHLPY